VNDLYRGVLRNNAGPMFERFGIELGTFGETVTV
jgi:hypothetical protein